MKTQIAFTALTLLLVAGAASAQTLPPSQQQLNAQTQQQLTNQTTQTQLQNLQTQQSIQQNELRQQQILSTPQVGGGYQPTTPAIGR